MGYEYDKVHNTEVARDSLGAVGTTELHDITSQTSGSVQVTVVDGTIDVAAAGASDCRVHLTESTGGTKLWTVSGATTGPRQLPQCPEVIQTSNGKNLGLEVTGDTCSVVASVIVGESY